MSVGGPISRTFAPSKFSSCTLERATRLCRISPQIAICRPPISLSLSLKAWRRVKASSKAWVGCSCIPSPALMTEQETFCASKAGAPELPWRTTSKSGFMALSVAAVSSSVSPFFTEEEATCIEMTSAPRRLPASSKDFSVRVEFSKKRLISVLPCKISRFPPFCSSRLR